jgi:hypothetical protein
MPGNINQLGPRLQNPNYERGDTMSAISANDVEATSIRAQRVAAGLTVRGLPRGYRNNPSLLQTLPDEPKRGFFRRNPENWLVKECLYCGAQMLSPKNRRKYCSVRCRRSYEFREKYPMLAM